MRIEYTKGERASKELILLHRQTSEATSGRKMKVMLIFPPDWFPSEPYLSLPSLTAVLRQAGHTVIQKDINLEMWDWYFSEDFLKKVLRRVPQQLDRLRKLGLRLRALATAREVLSSARLDDACAGALAELGSDGGRVRLAASLPFDSRVRGSAGAVSAAIVSLIEHALAASPFSAQIELAVRNAGAGAVVVAITAPQASGLGAVGRAPLDALLDAELRERRGDLSLVLAGAVAEALGGAVYVASDPQRGLAFELQLVAVPA